MIGHSDLYFILGSNHGINHDYNIFHGFERYKAKPLDHEIQDTIKSKEKRDNKQCLLDTPRMVTVNNKRHLSKCKKSEKQVAQKGNDAHLRVIIQSEKKWKHQFFRRLRAANFVVRGRI